MNKHIWTIVEVVLIVFGTYIFLYGITHVNYPNPADTATGGAMIMLGYLIGKKRMTF